MLNPEMSSGATYDLPIRQTLTHGAKAFGRTVYRLKPGPVLVIIAVEAFVQFCLALRLYFAFQGGTPEGIVKQAYDLSATLVGPFKSWDGTVVVSKGVFEISTIVAMDAYLFAGVGAIVLLVMLRTFAGFVSYVGRRRRVRRDRRLVARLAQEPQEPVQTPAMEPLVDRVA